MVPGVAVGDGRAVADARDLVPGGRRPERVVRPGLVGRLENGYAVESTYTEDLVSGGVRSRIRTRVVGILSSFFGGWVRKKPESS